MRHQQTLFSSLLIKTLTTRRPEKEFYLVMVTVISQEPPTFFSKEEGEIPGHPLDWLSCVTLELTQEE